VTPSAHGAPRPTASGRSMRGLGGLQPPCVDSLQVGGSKGEEERRGERERKGEDGRGRKKRGKGEEGRR
jgi:hypothetical protein